MTSWIQIAVSVITMAVAATVVVVRVESSYELLGSKTSAAYELLALRIESLTIAISTLTTLASSNDKRLDALELRTSLMEDRHGGYGEAPHRGRRPRPRDLPDG